MPRQRRVYAYIDYSANGRSCSRYVGQVTQTATREGALREAWQSVHDRGLLELEAARLCARLIESEEQISA